MKNNVFKIRSILLLAAAAATAHAAPPSLNSLLADAQKKIEAAGHHGQADALDQARLSIDKAAVVDPKNAWVWYYKGYAAYIENIIARAKSGGNGKEEALTEADQALQKSIDLAPSGDALALRVDVLAGLMQIRGGESAMELGPRIGEALGRARQMGPENPRVLMTAGISALYTPPEWGGDVHEAVKLLEHAIAAFGAEQVVPPQPSWGLAEAHVWLGLAHQKLGDAAKAKSEFENALAIDPNYAWVKVMLLPTVDKPAK